MKTSSEMRGRTSLASLFLLSVVVRAEDNAMKGMDGTTPMPTPMPMPMPMPMPGPPGRGDGKPSTRGNMDPIGMMGGKFTEQKLMKYLQPIDVGRNLTYDDLTTNDGYLCTRDCCADSKPRLCYFQFTVEQYASMGPACRNCTNGNLEDCKQQQCIAADGIERMVYSINRMIPAPQINVCAGDRIVVDILNMMTSAALTIHWHGVLQQKSPWMDGVPMVSQCPIHPNALFRYDFVVDELGSYFYHGHTGNVQRDGLYGALVVKHCKDPHRYQYDFDLPSHTIVVADWTHYPSDVFFPGYYLNESMIPTKPHNYLINGRGSYRDSVTRTNTPHQTFHVKTGYRYLFRVIGATFASCLFKFGIEGHSMIVVALDGYPCKPVMVNTLVMGSGTRTDVVVDTRVKPDQGCSYHMVVKGIDECENVTAPQTAYLVYDDCDPVPTGKPSLPTIYDRAPYLDHVVAGCEAADVHCSHELRAIDAASPKLTSGTADHQFFLNMTARLLNFDEVFENKMNPYQFFYEPVGGRPPIPGGGIFVDTINSVSCMMPPFPLLYQTDYLPDEMICHGRCNDPNQEYCFCLNVLEVKLNSTVELVLVDDMSGPKGPILNHPLHIHGHNWAILKQGSMDERMKNPDSFWVERVTANDPAIRDVIIIPSGGFAVVRFIANNPGYWMAHCHFQNHMMGGMFLLIKVGDQSEFLTPPADFPRCKLYLPDIGNIEDYERCGCECGSPKSECSKCTKPLECHQAQERCDCHCQMAKKECSNCTKPNECQAN